MQSANWLRYEQQGQYILKLLNGRVFAPSWVSILLTVLVVPGLTSLGLWQLRRADEKRQLMNQAEQGRVQVLPLTATNAIGLARYQRISVTGHYDSAHQVLLDNMPSMHGQPGYRVLTPFLLSDHSTVLVDRGWVPLTDRAHLPMVDVDAEPRTLTGMLDEVPRPGVRAGDAGIAVDHWPQVLNFPTYPELQSLYGPTLQSRLVLLDAEVSDGFERHWQIDLGFLPGFGPERHVGYAVQWFGMALTVAIIFLVVNLKRQSKVPV